jgi:pyruvate dehydrogenase E2 component (dihydrolipoamide acetyltransferase)
MAEVIMPKMGDAMTEGILLSWRKQDGETVKVGDVIAEIETDKSNVEVEAEEAGVLHTQTLPGTTVPVGQTIAVIGDLVPAAQKSNPAPISAGVSNKAMATKASETVSSPVIQNSSVSQERVKASPLARRVAKERGFDIAAITGTGPMGRIIEADVLAFVPEAKPAVAQPQVRISTTPVPATTPTDLSAMRKVIARRMVESKTTIPHFYITIEVDMAAAMALREQLNGYDDTLAKISFNDMIVKASALALKKVPAVNALFKDDKIYPGAGIHVGIAVALDDGLIVPVVRDADTLPLRKLAQSGRELIKKARDKKLQPSEYTGGTFTVSNLGSFDVETFQAIIDPSQGAILAVASIVKKPVVLDDGETIAIRPRMNLTFSGDHRVMDGATGAKFLQELKRLLQNPLSLLEG